MINYFARESAPKPLTRLQFMSRFTDRELIAIYTAAKQSVEIEVYLDKIRAAQDIMLTDQRTGAGVQSLADAGLIEPGRVSEILSERGDS
jgi:hypothetical protein